MGAVLKLVPEGMDLEEALAKAMSSPTPARTSWC